MPPIFGLFSQIFVIINGIIIPLILALAFLTFIIGVAQAFIFNQDNDEKRKEGRKYVLWGIIGIAIMLSVWGLVEVLTGTFGFEGATRPDIPHF